MAKIAIKYVPTFNKVIKALQANITRNLKTEDFEVQPEATAVTTSTLPVQIEDDIRTKLINV